VTAGGVFLPPAAHPSDWWRGAASLVNPASILSCWGSEGTWPSWLARLSDEVVLVLVGTSVTDGVSVCRLRGHRGRQCGKRAIILKRDRVSLGPGMFATTGSQVIPLGARFAVHENKPS
jgi:hypothetical protein